MAKTAEQKAAAAVAKAEAKPTPANVAAAAKAVAVASGASNKEAKAAAAAVKSSITDLKDSQQTEVKLLKQTGDKAAAKTEASANKAEFNDYLSYAVNNLGEENAGLLGYFNQGLTLKDGKIVDSTGAPAEFRPPITVASTPEIANSAAYQRLVAAQSIKDMYNMTGGLAPSGMSSTGISLTSIDRQLQHYDKNNEFMNNSLGKTLTKNFEWEQYRDPETGMLSLSSAQVGAVKPVPGSDNLYKSVINTGEDGNINRTTQYFTKNADGTFTPTSITKYNYDDAPEKSGLLGNVSLALQAAAFLSGQPWLATAANIASGVNAIQNKDILGLALSAASLGGYNVGGELGKLIAPGATAAAQAAIGNGIVGAFKNSENPFAGAAIGAAGSYLGSAWKASGGDWEKFQTLVGNGVDTGVISQADVDAGITEATKQGYIQTLQDQVQAGTLDVASANEALTAFSQSYGTPINYTFNTNGILNPNDGITTTDLPAPDYSGGSTPYTGTTSGSGTYGPISIPPTGSGLLSDVATPEGVPQSVAQEAQSQFEKELSRIQSQWESGQITEADAMNQIRNLNDMASNGDWTRYLADMSAGYTQLPGGGPTSIWDKAVTAVGGLTGLTLGNVLSTGTGMLGSYITGEAAKDAAETLAEEQARIAEMTRFRPVGVTTRFGESKFGYDKNGRLIYAGYDLAPDIKAQQDKLISGSNAALDQYLAAQGATAPMGTAAQRAMELGQGYLATTPQEQAAKYMTEQQALLATGRERELASLENRLLQQGRLGLATGGTSTGMMAANPELEAFYNAKRQQDLALAAQATQGGMDYAKFGAGMVGTGSDLLKQMYGTQTAAYQPYQTAIGGAQYLEGLGQSAMDLGTSIGAQQSTANANAANMLNQSAQTQATANAYSPWGALLSGAGNMINQYQQPQQQSAFMYNPYTGQKLI